MDVPASSHSGHWLNVLPTGLPVSEPVLATPVIVVALDVNVSDPVNVIVTRPRPGLTVGFMSVQIAMRRFVPMARFSAAGQVSACSSPDVDVLGSQTIEVMLAVLFVIPSVTMRMRLLP